MVAYNAQNSDELSYAAGQEIEALMKSSYGWWKVR
jgi:SH3 domain.